MPIRITEVAIPSNAAWKIVNDAPDKALLDSALGLVEEGGDLGILRSLLKKKYPRKEDKHRRSIMDDSVVLNLRSNEELDIVPWQLVPAATFGKLVVIDRDEIESYRAVRSLLRDYLSNREKKPLSLAVFGPPGSGKSFGIRELVKSINESWNPLEFNLAQFSRPEDLADAFVQITSEGTAGPPIAFFDEFDSRLGASELGWLKYFLAPMQDGEIVLNGKRHKIGRAVFVFAGGTSSTYRLFAREVNSTEQERYEFVRAKGPDFVSRLAGHIDVLGVNRREVLPDQSYVLRRALIIRSQLEQRKLIGRTKRALIDKVFLKKLLEVGRYKHGARSIAKVLDMCVGINGMLHLPPAEQLSMHVDDSDVERLLRF